MGIDAIVIKTDIWECLQKGGEILIKHIFVIDDDQEIRYLIRKYLEKEGFRVTDFSGPAHVLSETKRLAPDMLILDIMMPGLDGIELCKSIRRMSDIPIIFVSAKDEELDRIIGLEVGGDDYLAKPFSLRELSIRIKNIFRRSEQRTQEKELAEVLIHMGNAKLSPERRSVEIDAEEVSLTVKEFEILRLLMENPNAAFTRNQLMERIWGYDFLGETRVVDDVIKRIRKKLSAAACDLTIITVWGYGYKIEKGNNNKV